MYQTQGTFVLSQKSVHLCVREVGADVLMSDA